MRISDWSSDVCSSDLTEAKKQSLKLIIGSRFKINGMEIIILARNKKGYGDLSELITLARRRSEKGQYRLSLDDIATPASGCEHLQNLPDCLCIFKRSEEHTSELPSLMRISYAV